MSSVIKRALPMQLPSNANYTRSNISHSFVHFMEVYSKSDLGRMVSLQTSSYDEGRSEAIFVFSPSAYSLEVYSKGENKRIFVCFYVQPLAS